MDDQDELAASKTTGKDTSGEQKGAIIRHGLQGKIVLGIDPGTSLMGYGVVHKLGTKLSVLRFGVLHLDKYPDHYVRLGRIYARISEIIVEYRPDEVAIEAPFFGKNVQSMLKLGRAQGVAIAAALAHHLPVTEYAPTKIKLSITGKGSASKQQVAAMLSHQLDVDAANTEYLDETDALAVAVCHLSQGPLGKTTKGGWSQFLKSNPDRIR